MNMTESDQAYIFVENRLVLLYTFECDLGDGWEDPEVHNDLRYRKALEAYNKLHQQLIPLLDNYICYSSIS
jgi:hypothetical protein